MSRVLVIARPNVKRDRLCAALAHDGYEAVAFADTAAFRASRDWSLYDVLALEPQAPDADADLTLGTYVRRFRPAIVRLDARWSPEAVCQAIARRRREHMAERGTRRKPADFYGTPAEIADVEIILLSSAESPAPRSALTAATHAAGYTHWSGRMVKYVLRRLEQKGELRADEDTGTYHATDAGRIRIDRAAAAARQVS
jgi:hypothetical protein